MKAKIFLIMLILSMMISVPAFAESAEEEAFIGLVPMVYVGATNLPTAAGALLPQNILGTVGGGIEYACIAGDTLVKLTLDGANAVLEAGSNLDVAVVALLPQNILGTVLGGTDLILRGGGGILECVFGPPRRG